jgi:class III poly(R)-hydroxyalkanoic acid synthase PhaE subunit
MDQQQGGGTESLVESWMKTAAEFWGSTAKMWAEAYQNPDSEFPLGRLPGSRAWESLEGSLKTWQTLSTLMAEPGGLEGMMKGINTLPDILIRVMKPAWGGFFQLQREWMERAGRIGKSTADFKFEEIDREAFKIWNELYEKEFRQFLKIPQIGLLRVYQEHASVALDKFQVFQTTMAEFISLLHLPAEKSLQMMQEKLEEMAREGHLPEKTKEYYNMWVKILEGRYMILFKSPEYNKAIANTLDAMAEFLMAKKQILEDSLRSLPIPTQQETDELYREIYLLKKRVKQLEKST